MTSPLLATKLYIPPVRQELVPRPRLIERLNEGLRSGRRLTLVSAPAGYGKTTLIASWANQDKGRLVWVSLDEDDNDFSRFFIYVITAIQAIEGGFGEGLLMRLASPQPLPPERFLTYLVNDLYEIN